MCFICSPGQAIVWHTVPTARDCLQQQGLSLGVPDMVWGHDVLDDHTRLIPSTIKPFSPATIPELHNVLAKGMRFDTRQIHRSLYI